MDEFFVCHKCGDDLGDVVQGDCRMDDYAGVPYCDACWIRWEMDYRLWYLRWVLRRSSLGNPHPRGPSCGLHCAISCVRMLGVGSGILVARARILRKQVRPYSSTGVKENSMDTTSDEGPAEPAAMMLARGDKIKLLLKRAANMVEFCADRAERHIQAFRSMFCDMSTSLGSSAACSDRPFGW